MIAFVIAAVTAIALGCGSSDSGEVSNQLSPNQELRLRIAGDPGTFDPQLASFSEEISVV